MYFNSRTHGKHFKPIIRNVGTMFQFPHTRETSLMLMPFVFWAHFNSRTHGKHIVKLLRL